METLRFVHAADLHLDSPFQGVRNSAPGDIAAALHDATFAAYERIIDLCIQEEAQALLVAGDVYDGADRSLSAQLRFVEGLKRLDAAGVQSFVCHGNHDPLDGWTARLDFPESCHRFGGSIGSAPLGADGRATVYGISYPTRNVFQNLTPNFERRPDDGFAIGLLHANVGASGHENYAPCTLDDLRRGGMDYWALGHVHTRGILNPYSPAVVYPGNIQGRHTNEAGERGVCLVEVDGNNRPRIDFVPVCSVRWEAAVLSIDGLDSEQALVDALLEEAGRLLAGAGECDVVCRITLDGRGPLHDVLRRAGTLETLRDQVNEHFSRRSPFLWCERISDRSGPAFDRAARWQTDDFLGGVLRTIDDLQTDAAGLEAVLDEATAQLLNHPKARTWLRDYQPDRAQLLAEAENTILGYLLERR